MTYIPAMQCDNCGTNSYELPTAVDGFVKVKLARIGGYYRDSETDLCPACAGLVSTAFPKLKQPIVVVMSSPASGGSNA